MSPTRPCVAWLPLVVLLLMGALTWQGEARGGQLDLSWVNSSGDVLGFSIERSPGIAGPFTVLATTGPATTYADTGVVDSTFYCYRIRAFNPVGYSEYSTPACGSTPPTTLTLSLDVNQPAFALGDRFRVDITAANANAIGIVDVYFGGLQPPVSGAALGCPDDDAVAYVVDRLVGLNGLVFRCLSGGLLNAVPLYQSVSVPEHVEDFFGFNWPLTSAGNYTIFIFLTRPGTADVIALGLVTVGYAP